MSSKVNEIKNCATHQLQIVAVDLKATKEKQEKFLCVKCLIDRVDGNYIVLLKEGLEMIDQMKNKFKEQTISHTQQQQENIKSLQSSVLEMNKLFSDVFTKLQNNFDEIINSNQQDIQSKEKTVEEIDLDQDFETLSNIYKGNSDFDMPKPKIKIDNFKSLMDSVQSQFFSMANSQSFSQTFEQIKKIKSQYQNEFSIEQEFIQIYKNKTPSLKYNCKIHEQEIIMVNINECENEQQNRFACVECIQQYPNKYISLNEANKKWNQYKQQSKEINNNYQNQRQSKFNQAIQMISQFKQSYNNQINEIIQSLEKQYKLDESIITLGDNNQINFTIDELDQQEILKILNILSQKDQHYNLKQQQLKLNQDDSIYLQKFISNLDNLIQLNILNKNNLMNIFIDNQQQLININHIQLNQNQIDSQSIIQKFTILEQYINIIKDSFNYYKNLQQQINQIDLSQLLEQQQKEYQQFQSNSNLMQILIIAEDNSQILKVNQQQLFKLQELNIQQQEQLKQLNQEIDQLKKNELQLQNELQKNKQLNDTLNIKLNEQQQQYQQLQDTLNNNIKELKTKDQELQNQLLQHQDLLKELKCVYQFVSIQWTIGKNTILKDDYFSKILKTIEEKTKKKVKNQYFIYSGAQNGLNEQSFWKSVDKLSNLLMIFKSKSGYIFGAFSPCNWILNSGGTYIQDNTLSSFIFSQTHDQIYPIKEANKQHAIYCNQSYVPTFGGGHDINISTGFQGGYSNLGHSYQCDQYQISNKSTHLFGQSTPNIAECEILMLTFL